MAFAQDASEAFAEVVPYRNGAVCVGYYSSSSERERDPNGDEVVMVLEETTTIILRTCEMSLVSGSRQSLLIPSHPHLSVPGVEASAWFMRNDGSADLGARAFRRESTK